MAEMARPPQEWEMHVDAEDQSHRRIHGSQQRIVRNTGRRRQVVKRRHPVPEASARHVHNPIDAHPQRHSAPRDPAAEAEAERRQRNTSVARNRVHERSELASQTVGHRCRQRQRPAREPAALPHNKPSLACRRELQQLRHRVRLALEVQQASFVAGHEHTYRCDALCKGRRQRILRL
ncbi:hypothetical protein ACFPRL_18815 [Pseudoclavibacter helvolus]